MDEKRRPRHLRPLCGRHPLTVGALALLAMSGYELWVRLEDFWAWTSGIRHLSKVRGTPFLQDLVIVFEAPEMRSLGFKMLFLLAAIIFAIVCLVRRSRGPGAWVLLGLDVALAGAGAFMGLYSLHPSDWLQGLKLAPLALIAAGCVMNIVHRASLRRRSRGDA
ncbi:MAG: hypothetical protein IKQ80_00360 [Clostridia bacterium]|nr:hypothetical protein [Clostridia bacterium]